MKIKWENLTGKMNINDDSFIRLRSAMFEC